MIRLSYQCNDDGSDNYFNNGKFCFCSLSYDIFCILKFMWFVFVVFQNQGLSFDIDIVVQGGLWLVGYFE